jgi:soluble lytic murein transglycosylase
MRLLLIPFLLLMSSPELAGGVYSYVDANGVRVFTNLGSDRSHSNRAEGTSKQVQETHNYAHLVKKYAQHYGVDQQLVNAVIRVESNFDPLAISPKNCRGLMQLHPDTARRLGVENVFDPAQNIEGGVKYLSFLMSEFGENLDHVLAAYNAGENAVKKHQGIPPYTETRNYVRKVKSVFGRSNPSSRTGRTTSRRKPRVVRVIQPDGGLLFTNMPSLPAVGYSEGTR